MPASDTMNISLNAFIKLFAMDTPKQMAEISRRVQQSGGGYDFYRTLNLAVKAFIENKTKDEIDYILKSASNPSEADYNRIAFEAFERKFGKKKKKLSIFDKKQKVFLGNKSVCVIVAPMFMMETTGGMEVYQIWATQNPTVNNHMGGIACYLCKEAFRKTSAANYTFKFFDAVGERVFSKYYNNTPAFIDKTVRDISHWANQ